MMLMDAHHERLLKLVTEARKGLGLDKQADLIKASGLSRSTVRRFERGESIDETSLRKISRAIGWTPDSALDVLAGGEPTPAANAADAEADAETERAWQREPTAPGDLSQLIRNVVFEAAIGLAPGASAAQIRAVEERARKLAREAGYTVARERQDAHTEEEPGL